MLFPFPSGEVMDAVEDGWAPGGRAPKLIVCNCFGVSMRYHI